MDDNYSAVLAELDAEVAADAMAVAAGIYATVTLADRFRASGGDPVQVRVLGMEEDLLGKVTDVVDDAVVLATPAADWVIWFAALQEVSGLRPGHVVAPPRGRSGRSAARLLRPFAGHRVRLGRRGGVIEGMLRRVGADHLEVGFEPTVVPLSAALFVRGPSLERAWSA